MARKKTTSSPSPLFDSTARELCTIKLPYPPSLNRYYRTFRGRPVVSAEGKRYRQTVKEILVPAFEDKPEYTAAMRVWIEVMFPDRRKRDLDNLNKALLDSITHAGVWADDSLIHDLRLVRAGVEKPGHVRLHIAEIHQ